MTLKQVFVIAFLTALAWVGVFAGVVYIVRAVLVSIR